MNNPNWLVHCYNRLGKQIARFIIKNTSENNAIEEAENSKQVQLAYNWTITEICDQNQKIIERALEYETPI